MMPFSAVSLKKNRETKIRIFQRGEDIAKLFSQLFNTSKNITLQKQKKLFHFSDIILGDLKLTHNFI